MRKLFLLLTIFAAALGQAAETYIGLYMMGSRIGYSRSNESKESLSGQEMDRSDSLMLIDAGLLGQSMSMRVESTTWKLSGKPQRMLFKVSSSGRSQLTEAVFREGQITLKIDNNGAKSEKTIKAPEGEQIVDDALTDLVLEGSITGNQKVVYVLDPMTASLVKNTIKVKGPTKVKVKDQEYDATLIVIDDPRASTSVYISAKGDFIKGEGPMGMEMIPITKEEALGKSDTVQPRIDLANASSIKPNKAIDIKKLKSVTLRISGRDLSQLPNDAHQKVMKVGEAWQVTVHPIRRDANSATLISAAQAGRASWLKPSLNIPSDTKTFTQLSQKIVGKEKRVSAAADKIRAYVYDTMTPNAGIGVLRDASEVLKTKEGVCRDYAILTATLLRSAGIPARLCSGLVYFQESFYYHAWVEFWDGKNWIGLDSTLPDGRLHVGHVKLANGNVEDAFTFTFLDGVRVEVLDTHE